MATKKKASVAASKNKAPESMAAQIAASKKAVKDAKDKVAAYEKADKVAVKITDNVARFNLPYAVGTEKEIEVKTAVELVEHGYAVLVKEDQDLKDLKKKLGIKED